MKIKAKHESTCPSDTERAPRLEPEDTGTGIRRGSDTPDTICQFIGKETRALGRLATSTRPWVRVVMDLELGPCPLVSLAAVDFVR